MDRFPKVTAAGAAASRVVGPWLAAMGHRQVVDLGAAGAVRISFGGVGPVELSSREEFLLLGSDGRRGRLAIDGWLALAVVSACLRQGAPTMLRKLGVGERGVLAAQILPVIARAGGDVTLALESAALPSDEPLLSLALDVESPMARGRVRLELPRAWLVAPGARALSPASAGFRGAAGRLHTTGSIELGTTRVPAADWAAARAGDAVVFDGTAAVSISSDWPVGFRIGDYSAAAGLGAGGVLSLAGPFRSVAARVPVRTVRPTKEIATMSSQSSEESSESQESQEPQEQSEERSRAVLAAAPIEVVAEVGRMTLRGDEVLGLGRGSVLSFGARGPSVVLTAGGEPWARGELVDVDGELGVRLTELVR